MKAAERRVQILEVAIAAFGEGGFKGTTTKAIARAAGVSEASVFRHFPSKEALYIAAFEHRTAAGSAQFVTVLEGFADRGDDEGLLRTLIQGILAAYEQDRGLQRMMLYASMDQNREANARMFERIGHSPVIRFLGRWVARRQAEGVFCTADSGLLSAAVLALAAQWGTQTKLFARNPAPTPPGWDEQVAETLARLLLHGLHGPPAGERPPGASTD